MPVSTVGSAGDQPGDGRRVAADVEDRSATERAVVEAQLRIDRPVETEHRRDEPELADGPLTHELRQLRRLRVAAIHERLHQENLVPARRRDDQVAFLVEHAAHVRVQAVAGGELGGVLALQGVGQVEPLAFLGGREQQQAYVGAAFDIGEAQQLAALENERGRSTTGYVFFIELGAQAQCSCHCVSP